MEAHGSYLISAVFLSHFSQMVFFLSLSHRKIIRLMENTSEAFEGRTKKRTEKLRTTATKRTLVSAYACILYEAAAFLGAG